MINFCWGDVRAKTISVWYIRISSKAFSLRSLISPPWTTAARASLGLTSSTGMPFLVAISSTVSVPSDDADRASDGLGSDGVVAGDHDHLDASRPALQHSIRHSSSGRVNHRHQSNKAESLEGEVLLICIVGVASRVLVRGQHVVAEAKNSLAEPSELHVGGLERVLPILSQGALGSVDDNC